MAIASFHRSRALGKNAGIMDFLPCPPPRLLQRYARVVVPALVVPKDRSIRLRHPGKLLDTIGHGLESFFALAQRLLRLRADPLYRAKYPPPRWFVTTVVLQFAATTESPDRTIGQPQPKLHIAGYSRSAAQAVVHVSYGGPVFRDDPLEQLLERRNERVRESPYIRYISSDQISRPIESFGSNVQLPICADRVAALKTRRCFSSLSRSASSACLRPVMSRAIFEAPTIAPLASRIGEMVTETSIFVPSFLTRTVSKCSMLSPRRMRARMSRLLVDAFRRQQQQHWFAHDLCSRVTEHLLSAPVPGGNRPIQGLADNGVIG